MSTNKNQSKKAKVWAYLRTGKGITYTLAETRFGVKNLRATISNLKNAENVRFKKPTLTKEGQTRYSIA
jgi:hypothetical protein